MNQLDSLYSDYNCEITSTNLRVGAVNFPIGKISSITNPIQERFELFGGLILNGALLLVGLTGIATFSWLWGILGLIAALIGGFNVWGQFHRPWYIAIHIVDGERLNIERPKKEEIFGEKGPGSIMNSRPGKRGQARMALS